jgi:hypothetical protein
VLPFCDDELNRPNKHQRRQAQCQPDGSTGTTAIDRTQQLPESSRIGDRRVVFGAELRL